MLRRSAKRKTLSKDNEKRKKLSKNIKLSVREPMGSSGPKDASESVLESLVLGGDDDIIKELENKPLQESDQGDDHVPSHTVKQAAWQDEDDEVGSIQLSTDRRFVGIKHGDEKKITKKEYNERLVSQFERVASTPNWAKLPSERKPRSEDEDSDVEDILHRTGTYLQSSSSLPKSILNIKSCTDVNKEAPIKGRVKCLEFHPSAQVALSAGCNNTLSLFQVDGKTNPKIQSLFVESFPIYCAHFSRDGEQVVMGSKHKSFKYFDMIGGQVVNVPMMKGLEETSMMNFETSPDGKYLVFLGKYGRMYFISAKSKEWLFTLQMNGGVTSIAFTSDGSKMFSHGDNGQVYVWDLKSRDCIHKFIDDGCTQGLSIAVSPNNQYIATGSYSGVVNLYETDSCVSASAPRPLKAIMNLTSACTLTKFNATSEILAVASKEDERAIKLVHVPSQSVFSNFPDRMDAGMRIPTAIDFSVNSGYMAIGTHKGSALLYRLKHYGNY